MGFQPKSHKNDQKSDTAFRTISEVSKEIDVPPHVLRFWETKFKQIKPLKRGGGRRYYRPSDIYLLKFIRKLLYSDGYTIKGVQKLLNDGQFNMTQQDLFQETENTQISDKSEKHIKSPLSVVSSQTEVMPKEQAEIKLEEKSQEFQEKLEDILCRLKALRAEF